jgi:signal peptidase I
MTRPTVRSRKIFRSYIEAFILAIVIGLIVRFYVITPYKIPSSAMVPTLLSGDYVFVYKLPYGLDLPFLGKLGGSTELKRGSVVLFSYPKSPQSVFIKRIIAIGGDKVEMRGIDIYVNDIKVQKKPLEPQVLGTFKSKDSLEFSNESFEDKSYVVSHFKNSDSNAFGPFFVPQGEVFLLGDNRDGSDDLRYWGSVPVLNIIGRVWMIWFSFDSDSAQLRWSRILKIID